MANDQAVIATAGIVSVGVGSANSILKYHRPPSTRFLIGSGVTYLLLSAMTNSDVLAEIAKGLALGIMTTILLGEGGGVLSYFAGDEETNTAKAQGAKGSDAENSDQESKQSGHSITYQNNHGASYHPGTLAPFPGLPGRVVMPSGKVLPQ